MRYLITENEKREILIFEIKEIDVFSSNISSRQPFYTSEFGN